MNKDKKDGAVNDKRILSNIGVSFIAKPISIIISLFSYPLLLSVLGEEKYGVWAIILNIISWINYFDIGIGNGLKNKLSESETIGDQELSKHYVATAFRVTTIISAIFFIIICATWCLGNLSSVFNMELTSENTDIVIVISVFFVCINFILGLYRTIMYSIQMPSVISVVSVIISFINLLVLFIASRLMNISLYFVAITYGLETLLTNIVLRVVIKKRKPHLICSRKYYKKDYIKPLLALGLGFFAQQICSLVLNTTDNLLISYLYGSASVTPYNMVYKVFNIFIQVHGIIIMPMWAAYTAAKETKEFGWIKKTVCRVDLVTLLLILGVCIAIFIFKPFANWWLGTELDYGDYLIPIMAIYTIAQMIANNYASFLNGMGKIKLSVVLSVIGAVINIPLSIYFAQGLQLGLAGIILGSTVVMLLSTILLPIYSHILIKRMESVKE